MFATIIVKGDHRRHIYIYYCEHAHIHGYKYVDLCFYVHTHACLLVYVTGRSPYALWRYLWWVISVVLARGASSGYPIPLFASIRRSNTFLHAVNRHQPVRKRAVAIQLTHHESAYFCIGGEREWEYACSPISRCIRNGAIEQFHSDSEQFIRHILWWKQKNGTPFNVSINWAFSNLPLPRPNFWGASHTIIDRVFACTSTETERRLSRITHIRYRVEMSS